MKTMDVEDATSLEDYQPSGGYGEALREALEEAREQDALEAKEEEGAGDSLEKDEATKAGK